MKKKAGEKVVKIASEEALRDVGSIVRKYGVTRYALRELMHEYLKVQRARVAAELRIKKIVADGRPAPVWTEAAYESYKSLEASFKEALVEMATYFPEVSWAANNIRGVQHIAAAGVAAFLTDDIPHVGHAWSYFGLIPNATGGNRDAKSRAIQLAKLVVMAGDDYYKPLYVRRKAYEWRKNLSGENAEMAKRAYKRMPDNPWYAGLVSPEYVRKMLEQGKSFPITIPKHALLDRPDVPMINPGWVDSRARRWLAKLLISHLFEVGMWYRDGRRTAPYSIKYLGHEWGSYIPPKNPPWENTQA